MPLVEICHLRPGSPEFATIRKDRWEILAYVRNGLDCRAERRLLTKKWDVSERSEKEKEQRTEASNCARIEEHLSQRHYDHKHRHECGYAK